MPEKQTTNKTFIRGVLVMLKPTLLRCMAFDKEFEVPVWSLKTRLEYDNLRSQFVMSRINDIGNHDGRRYLLNFFWGGGSNENLQ